MPWRRPDGTCSDRREYQAKAKSKEGIATPATRIRRCVAGDKRLGEGSEIPSIPSITGAYLSQRLLWTLNGYQITAHVYKGSDYPCERTQLEAMGGGPRQSQFGRTVNRPLSDSFSVPFIAPNELCLLRSNRQVLPPSPELVRKDSRP